MEKIQRFSAELIGTFVLIALGAGAVLADVYSQGGVGLVGIALAHGLAIMVMVYAFGPVSGGHFNPAITVAMWLTRRIGAAAVFLHLTGQLAGAIAGALVIKYLFPLPAEALRAAVPNLGIEVSLSQGLVVEALITFLLTLVVFAITASDRLRPHEGVPVGMAITMLILMAGPLTGAAINPARAFGPAVANGYFANHYIYWLGPVLGAVLAGLIYELIFYRRRSS